jgi:hypothetical protein
VERTCLASARPCVQTSGKEGKWREEEGKKGGGEGRGKEREGEREGKGKGEGRRKELKDTKHSAVLLVGPQKTGRQHP